MTILVTILKLIAMMAVCYGLTQHMNRPRNYKNSLQRIAKKEYRDSVMVATLEIMYEKDTLKDENVYSETH